ncbi:MAG TPA: 2-C-methyl-D-erythritol 4-phosphate cytidylyltransferase [Cryptosporangiaceae bacterium]|nr:2-C-methyl-D-erythritol 4-phosphate cytidylyltransferase [Cryptosporangiaceae bacterium]
MTTRPSSPDVHDTVALVPAAGRGERLGAGAPKSLRELGGVPLVVHAVTRLAAARSVAAVVVAAPPGAGDQVRALLGEVATDAELIVVDGGANRQESVKLALAAAPAGCDIVLVHDAARALAPPDLADEVAAAVRAGHPAVVPVLPLADTVKRVGPAGAVVATVDRSDVRLVQTPQGFRREILLRAHAATGAGPATDDAGLVERLGVPVHTVPGRNAALKVTRPFDLVVAEALLDAEALAHPRMAMPDLVPTDATPTEPLPELVVPDLAVLGADSPAPVSPAPAGLDVLPEPEPAPLTEPRPRMPRVGVGVDVHAYDEARPCWVAGLHWPDMHGLAGHSDGDVVAHAACDALLSAAGLGDLGSNFGTEDPDWAGASGVALLSEAARRVRGAGFEVGNVAVQLIGSAPRLGPRRVEAATVLSNAVGAPVTVGGTTTDSLGFIGRNEGLAAVATALLLAP